MGNEGNGYIRLCLRELRQIITGAAVQSISSKDSKDRNNIIMLPKAKKPNRTGRYMHIKLQIHVHCLVCKCYNDWELKAKQESPVVTL